MGKESPSSPVPSWGGAQPWETSCRTDLFLQSQVMGKRQPSCCLERPPVGWGVRDLLVSVVWQTKQSIKSNRYVLIQLQLKEKVCIFSFKSRRRCIREDSSGGE